MVEVLLAVIAALIAITLVMAALILIRLNQIVVQEPLTHEMVSQLLRFVDWASAWTVGSEPLSTVSVSLAKSPILTLPQWARAQPAIGTLCAKSLRPNWTPQWPS